MPLPNTNPSKPPLPGAGVVAFLWVEGASPRLQRAQQLLESSILHFGLQPMKFPAGRELTPFGELLKAARARCQGRAFVWCNSDVVLTRHPFDVPDPNRVYGFHRREIPSGHFTGGIDMYYIPTAVWDNVLSHDIPRLLLGASYVDWWISRKAEQIGLYETLTGYIDHESHPQSPASGSDRSLAYQANFREYNRWARRNGLNPIPAPPYILPYIGHVWGLRDAIRKALALCLAKK